MAVSVCNARDEIAERGISSISMGSSDDGTNGTTKNALTHSDADKARAIRAYRKSHSVTQACERAGIGRTTWYEWRKHDPAFDHMVADAEVAIVDKLEATAIKRATQAEGPSDTLLIFLLKNLRRERFGDRQTLTVVSTEIQARLEKQIAVITSRESWASDELIEMLEGIWA
jgi:hypothetical protein